ncbi:MAG TPA: NADH-quinone oxidoreductase subunit N [Anaerolineales bacterium]|nr:NADH-quinone oxidoreductase subunit N [Anaerolineales bacterium]
MSGIDTTMILAILPEILLLILAGLVLSFDLVWSGDDKRGLGWLTAGGLMATFVVSLLFARPDDAGVLVWGGMLRYDWIGFGFTLLFIFGAAITALLAMDVDDLGDRGEFYTLMLVSTIGMSLMAASADMIMLYLSIETTSIPMYILAGFFKRDDKSTEAGFKYMLFGAMASGIMLYGFSLLFGYSGTTGIYALSTAIQAGAVAAIPLVGSLFLILVGFAFKISAVPFHFWAPDVYEGAPTPVTGFLSTASKAAGFAVLIRFFITAFPTLSEDWGMVIAIISVLTMTLGNFLAINQTNIKRMLAYSSIAHAGYVLIGVATVTALGTVGAIFYLIIYLVTNLAAFGIVTTFGRKTGSDEIKDYDGLSRRAPRLALVAMVAFLSLAGMPPFGGFIAKVLVLAAAVQADMVWLAVVGVLNSIVGLYYYLIVLKHIYLYRSDADDIPIPVGTPTRISLSVLTAGVILLGVIFAPWFGWSTSFAASLF